MLDAELMSLTLIDLLMLRSQIMQVVIDPSSSSKLFSLASSVCGNCFGSASTRLRFKCPSRLRSGEADCNLFLFEFYIYLISKEMD